MRAAVVHEFGVPLAFDDVAVPVPGPGQVVARIETSGLCHTDIHIANGEWLAAPRLPLIIGHEGVGVVERCGPSVSSLSEGDRIAIPWLGWACGACDVCSDGWEPLCPEAKYTGYTLNGAFAEYALADAAFAVRVPDEVDPLDAAPLSCAGVSSYRAVELAGVGPSDVLVVFGVGGLGHLAVQYANIKGATVVAVDVVEHKLRLAEKLGASRTINAASADPVREIASMGGADAAIVMATGSTPAEQALAALRRRGRLILAGLPGADSMRVSIRDTVFGGKQIIGSLVGTRADLNETFELHADGQTQVVREARHFGQLNEAMNEVRSGAVDARVVFDLRIGGRSGAS